MNKLNVFGYGYYSKKPIQLIKQFFRNCKYAWQRATKGYCDQDIWNLDNFYSWLFVNSLEEFKQNLTGCPSEFYDKENDSDEAWKEYLEEMKTHFYNSIDKFEVYENLPEKSYRKEEMKKGFDMMTQVFFDLWD